MAVTTTTEISAPVNNVFQVNLLRNAKALCPYFVGMVGAEIMEHQGTFTARWRRIENLTPTTTPLAEITGSLAFPTRTPDQPTITDVTATVQKFGNFFFLNEEVDLVNFNGQTAKLSEVLGINAGQSLNRLQRNVLEDNSTAVFHAGATTATDVGGQGGISLGDIAFTINALHNQNAMKFTPILGGSQNIGTTPLRDSFWGICHVDTEEHIRTLNGFNSAETYYTQVELAPGEFGAVGGVRWISTTEAGIDADSGATVTGTATTDGRTTSGTSYDVYNTMIIGREAAGSVGFGFEHIKTIYRAGDTLPGVMMISHMRGSAGAADPLNEVSSLGWKSWHTGTILNSNWLRVVRHPVPKLVA